MNILIWTTITDNNDLFTFSDHCEMRYTQKPQLKKHMDAIHLKKKDYVCSICGKCLDSDYEKFLSNGNFSKENATRETRQ